MIDYNAWPLAGSMPAEELVACAASDKVTAMSALLRGERSELMMWVNAYPAQLVRQPDLI